MYTMNIHYAHISRGGGEGRVKMLIVTLNTIFSIWLYLMLLPPYHAEH